MFMWIRLDWASSHCGRHEDLEGLGLASVKRNHRQSYLPVGSISVPACLLAAGSVDAADVLALPPLA